MLLGAIKITFLVTVAALVVDVGAVDGIAEYAIGVVLVLCAVALFNAGCRVAARQARRTALNNNETTLDLILTGTGDHPSRPQPYQAQQDQRGRPRAGAQ